MTTQTMSTRVYDQLELESYTIKDNIKVIERFFHLPLDYSDPDSPKIKVFARNLVPLSKVKAAGDEGKLPYLIFLQGGPGFEVSLPGPGTSGFASEIHEQGYQTLWLDPRGTGLSTPVSAELLASKTDEEKAQYLKHFRADSIVNDCEEIRKLLLAHKPLEDQKWTVMGQSFGGFCALTYLSFHSEGLKEVFIAGGLAPLVDSPDAVYEALLPILKKRNRIYYEKYPRDVQRVREIVGYLEDNDVQLPDGGRLTVGRWQQLGMSFGMHGGIDSIHQIVFRASNDLALFNKLSHKTLQNIQVKQAFDGNPIYAILHEPEYCHGQASNWAASRVLKKHSQFSWANVKALQGTEPLYFTGEMVFPENFDDYYNLRPLKGAAELLAKDSSWGPLYDLDQLLKNEVKVTAVTYVEDMYVDFALAQNTASQVKKTEQYITNQLFHNGISTDGKDIMNRLFQLSRREYD